VNFASITFLYYFLPLAIGLYYLCPGRKARNLFLLAASLVFYSWGEGLFLILLLGSILFNHAIASLLALKHKTRWLCIGLAGNLALLLTFKYANWVSETLPFIDTIEPRIHLPLGISFFTFQAMSMLVDVYRGQKKARSVLDTGLYIAMFPQLIAGPIVRFNEIRDDIYNRTESLHRFAQGAIIFVLGLSQKVLLADSLAIPADAAFGADPQTLALSAAWIGLICFSLQIYYDFAGYSNMAIGLGRFFGFELPRNFDYPYCASSFREFWRRWHMTLSRWFRDYLYIPLGGSRFGALSTYRNLLIVFILCGLWHGAAWTFLLWGLWHGAFLILERVIKPLNIQWPAILGMVYVWIFVTLGWVLFRAENLEHALSYGNALFNLSDSKPAGSALEMTNTVMLALFIGLLLIWQGWEKRSTGLIRSLTGESALKSKFSEALQWAMIGALYLLCFFSLSAQTHQAFIYFRF